MRNIRSEGKILELIISTAKDDDRIRAVIMNGSRTNPKAKQDPFQDFDIIYVVTDVDPFRFNKEWINIFGELMIKQTPEDMLDTPPGKEKKYTYLMQFTDGNRIDLSLFPLTKLDNLRNDSLSVILLDKDNLFTYIEPPSERDYLPIPPSAKAFVDCCNEFWWVCPYVAKGLWRKEILYAKTFQDQILREELMKMITWYLGYKTQYSYNLGKFGKHFQQYFEPELWEMLGNTYSDAKYEGTWDALFITCDLFRRLALGVAEHYGFDYPKEEDEKVSAHLEHIRGLPGDADEIY